MWQTGRIFKIIGLHEKDGRRQTTLLEIPEDALSYLWGPSLIELERDFARQAEDSFREAFSLLPVPELNKPEWLSRLTFPIGIDDQANFFPLFEAPEPPLPGKQPARRWKRQSPSIVPNPFSYQTERQLPSETLRTWTQRTGALGLKTERPR
ncbi:hypothetical protein JQ629_31040 [Bradyrhizobium sp. AUGA SZCCT0222]|uniref:hypothetical protein n=1 Tax=Bradyrhizobium sp. AUGA SZCCT0222 TaxID=2807668 RepID=UPI001BADF86E|nr:hypothetical protein [Bradyrhizobium sp. AUGA SZCCT0222]MBR1271927.1 hypothetical protein [Bradyrhizobium sp. AUGA SZCCT0222]